jgi:hypothetical protein
MKPNWRRSAAVLGTLSALLLAGCGGNSQPAATQGAAGAPRGPGARFTDANLTKLADTLGVPKTKLQAALKSALPNRGQGPPSQPPPNGQAPPAGQRPRGGPGNIAATLAKQLGLPEAKVRTALQQVLPQGGRRPGRPSASTTPS